MQCTFDTISRWHGIDHTYVDFSHIHFKFTFVECVCLCVMAITDYLTKKKNISLWPRTIWLLFFISKFSMMRLSLNHALKYVSINFSALINMRIVQGIHDISSIFTWSVLILVCHSIEYHSVLIFMRINFIIIHKSMIFQWRIRVCLWALFQLFYI